MRVLILGATGMLGKDLLLSFPEAEVVGAGFRDADIRDRAAVQGLIQKAQPDWIILSAAYTDVDGCEKDPKRAFEINRDGAVHVARAAAAAGAKLLFLSTDYVFDGTKGSAYEVGDPLAPINTYGRSKAEAETALQQILPECCIVRTSWLFGTGGKSFPDTILRLAQKEPELRVVDDQTGSPTYTVDLATAISALIYRQARGIIHATNRGSCSWFEFARQILLTSQSRPRIGPVSTEEFPRPAKRPAYSVLSGRSLETLGIEMPDWRDALARFLRQRRT
jgi:dTDP-4-dehydrorhamnose reductase